MLGHLRPQFSKKTTASTALQNYRNAYCGICASLRKNYSQPFSLLVNHELTLALLALRPYYQAETTAIKTNCPAKLYLKKYNTEKHEIIDKAADFSLLLATLKLTDIKVDKNSNIADVLLKFLNKKQSKVYQSLSKSSQKVIEQNIYLTKSNPTDFNQTLHQLGLLSQTLFEELAQVTSIFNQEKISLARLFYKIGRLIPLADALIDWTEDSLTENYNPILEKAKEENQNLEKAYYFFRKIFQSLLYEIINELKPVQNLDFEEWLMNALRRLEKQVQRKRLSKTCSTSKAAFKPILMRNDCDCDCDCGSDSDSSCCSFSCCSCGGEDNNSCSICDCCESEGEDIVDGDSSHNKKKKKEDLQNPLQGD